MIAGPGEAKRSLSQRTRSNKCHRRKSGWMVERHCLLLATLWKPFRVVQSLQVS